MQVADLGDGHAHDLAVGVQNKPEHTVGGGVVRAHIEEELLPLWRSGYGH
jgi:hypothetical protein